MITQQYIYVRVPLSSYQIEVTLCAIWLFSEKVTADVINKDEQFVTEVRREMRNKIGGKTTDEMALRAQRFGFKDDGTINGNDIFSNAQKRKILLIDDTIVFRFPIDPTK